MIFTATYILLVIFGGVILSEILSIIGLGFSGLSLQSLVISAGMSMVIAFVVGWVCARIIEGLPLRSLGCSLSNKWFKHLCLGLTFGTFSILLATVIPAVFGGIRFHLNQNSGMSGILLTIGISAIVFILGAFNEELLFRGYPFQTFSRAGLAWLGIFLTSVPFGLAHLGNDGATIFSTINTILAGVWFGIGYLRTRTLWFPFAMHFTWNWVQGAFLGIPVSGIKFVTTAPVLQVTNNGPNWFTGGDYGIEGGAACTIALIVSTALIWFLPILKPTEEMMILTGQENPVTNQVES